MSRISWLAGTGLLAGAFFGNDRQRQCHALHVDALHHGVRRPVRR